MKKAVTIFVFILMICLMSFSNHQPDLKASIERGKKVYTSYCLACHQADGTGVPRMNPPLIQTPYVKGDKKRLINVILKGLNEEVEINGEFYDNPMPPQPQLTDMQIADVLTYVRNSFGNKGTAVTAAEVKTMRIKK
jgi:mono/diheme cytochrome c family protein